MRPTIRSRTTAAIIMCLIMAASTESAADPAVIDLIDLIDLNRATATQLMTLPGIGEQRARDIITFRQRRPFRRRSDLLRVRGIGRRTYARLRPLVRVGPPAAVRSTSGSHKPQSTAMMPGVRARSTKLSGPLAAFSSSGSVADPVNHTTKAFGDKDCWECTVPTTPLSNRETLIDLDGERQ